jgi:histidinol dehydrogenase
MVGALRDVAAALPALLDRSTAGDAEVQQRTADIIARVRGEGDCALRALARSLDGVELQSLEVDAARVQHAFAKLDPALRAALERSARNIRTAHEAFLPPSVEIETEPGVTVGRRADPLGAVGVYAPGGRAAYPSSVLMGAIPARVAGVRSVILCSPPGADGLPSSVVLAAAAIAGVDRIFSIGGAGAIAAMAYGTASVPRVDRIVGPGNAYVTEAKLQVMRAVGIDSPAGPSELMVIADDSADACIIARELLAQAEHDPRAAVLALAPSEAIARAIVQAVETRIDSEPRGSTIREALAARGAVLWYDAPADALAFAAEYAPEHLLLAVREPAALLPHVRNAGTVFLGSSSSVAFGDYMTGANHVLPTAGAARMYSGLSTADFMRVTSWQRISPDAAARFATDVPLFAAAEGLPAHAAAAGAWRTDTGSTAASAAGHWRGRPSYRDITLYAPDRTPARVDLSDNTNLWGMPPAAERAVRDAARDSFTRYPALYASDLKSALASYLDVPPDAIVTGCGSDDVLDSAIRAFVEPGQGIACPDPSFQMIPTFARMNGLHAVPVPLTPTFDMDADAMLATRAPVIYLCSPNNPTGTVATRATVDRVIREAPGVVIIDEAYAEFMGAGLAREAPLFDNVLVTRTLSKAFGLAGLRVGYAVGSPALVAEVEKSRGPYKISALAERAAVAALREDMPWVRAHVAEAIENRERFAQALVAHGLEPLSSRANFVLVPVRDARTTSRRMRERGVAVRPFEALPLVGDALRVTMGPWPLLEAALQALDEALQCT